MKLIKATFVVVTPMFLGDGDMGCAQSIRGASIKGALRAHFRALNWSRIRQANEDNQSALNALHQEEAALFGSAVKDKKGGQASFLLRVKSHEFKPAESFNGCTAPVQYLLGMGLYKPRQGLLRSHIPADTKFTLELALKPTLSEQQIKQLSDTLLAFGLLGGLGSRSRKGFGSVTIKELEVLGKQYVLPGTTEEYKQSVKALVGEELAIDEPPFTAFSALTTMQISGQQKDAVSLLDKHGKEMGLYRGYGNNAHGEYQVFKQRAEKNFKEDHDWAYDFSQRKEDKTFIPKRSVFGMPHPYRLGSGTNIRFEPSSGRRASPLFAHIHQLPSGNHLLVHTVYRSEFLPEDISVKAAVAGGRHTREYTSINEKIDWTVLERFLQRFRPSAEDVIYG